ncbi:MAG: DsrE family protein [Cyclobacteriaceae bacterium]
MKRWLVFLFITLPLSTLCQNNPVKILFDITSKDTLTHQAVLRHVSGMSEAYPAAILEVVVYGGALPMVVKQNSSTVQAIEKLAHHKNVSFKVCAITMKRYDIASSDLITGVQVVPDAIMEIVTKQGQGWGYIKESHN